VNDDALSNFVSRNENGERVESLNDTTMLVIPLGDVNANKGFDEKSLDEIQTQEKNDKSELPQDWLHRPQQKEEYEAHGDEQHHVPSLTGLVPENDYSTIPRPADEQQQLQLVSDVIVDDEKKEFLQDWLKDLRTRTRLYDKKSQYACNASSIPNTWDDANTKTVINNDNEHEQFIKLCKAMMDKMDLMISKSATCQKNLDGNDDDMRSRKIRTKKNSRRRSFFPYDVASTLGLMGVDSIPSSASSSSSSANFAELGENNDEDEAADLQMFQKCLANLEQMNMRRTNHALTQTLIIKVLRKLMAKQMKEESRVSDEVARKFSPVQKAVIVKTSVSPERNWSENAGNCGEGSQTAVLLTLTSTQEQARTPADDMLQVITNVTKSIIYHDFSRNNHFRNRPMGDFQSPTANGDDAGVQEFSRRKFFAPDDFDEVAARRTKIIKKKRTRAIIEASDTEYRKPNSSKILLQLRQLEIEEQGSASIPLCWLFLALIFTLSQFSLFRVFKYLINTFLLN
jgi:hypothetical protein